MGRHSILKRGAGTGGLVLAGPSRPIPVGVRSRPAPAGAQRGGRAPRGPRAPPRGSARLSRGQGLFKHLPPSAVSLSRAKGTVWEYFSGFGWFAVHKYFQFGRESLWALLGPEGQNPGSWMSRWC